MLPRQSSEQCLCCGYAEPPIREGGQKPAPPVPGLLGDALCKSFIPHMVHARGTPPEKLPQEVYDAQLK